MLLRSASTPFLNSWTLRPKDSSPEPEMAHPVTRSRSVALISSSLGSLTPINNDFTKKISRALSETDLSGLSAPKRKQPVSGVISSLLVEEEIEVGSSHPRTASLDESFMNSGLDERCEAGLGLLVDGGTGGGSGKVCGGGDGGDRGGTDGNDSEMGSWDSNHGNDRMEAYYQQMIEANPGNGLLLSNYAKYLKEVRWELAKAEEYCARAILANPNDGNVLSMYADLIWQGHKDSSRAETYFDQAVKASPDDCYVLASYAKFLWDAEEDADEVEKESSPASLQASIFYGATSHPPSIAAAS